MAIEREWLDSDYYATLGVSPDATAKEITSAYRRLAKAHHPDASGGEDSRFKEISAAYDVIGDDNKRPEYDEARRLAASGAFTSPGGYSGYSSTGSPFDGADFDLSDLLGSFVGHPPARPARHGVDLETTLTLPFRDAALGTTLDLSVSTNATCTTCHGTRAQPGTQPQTCPTCQGAGTLGGSGLFSLQRTCPTCEGLGSVVTTPCPTCVGRGLTSSVDAVKVRIPTGVAQGSRIRVKGHGALAQPGGPCGDLYVTALIAPDPTFSRSADNLTTKVAISYAQAVLGDKLTVATLDKPVTLKIPAGTPSGKTFRVKGRGIKAPRHPAGDLLVTVTVDVPTSLTAAQRANITELAKLLEPPDHQSAS
jgi:molecular chaperone DnaJ